MRVLVIGYNPPPFQPGSKLEAANYRTWQFVQPLLNDGHELVLCVDARSPRPDVALLPPRLTWEPVPVGTIGWMPRLQAIHDRFLPDCIVAVDFYPALWATRLTTAAPVWMDFYGDPLTISQVARYRAGSDQGIGTTIALMRHALRRGDVFSVCGTPQRDMLVGELAMVGRLNSRTLGYEFTRIVRPGAPPVPDLSEQRAQRRASLGIPDDSFVVLWCGGYNTWTDIDTLYSGVVAAMAKDARIRFLSVGASTYQAPETVYDRLVRSASGGPFADRFHLLGWQPWQDIAAYYAVSDVGVNIDAVHYETVYGTRTRLVEMLAHGLPVITSFGCELSYDVSAKGAGIGFPSGDAEGFAQAILGPAASPSALVDMRCAARKLGADEWSFRTTTEALREWVCAPASAPDRDGSDIRRWLRQLRFGLRMRARLLLWRLGLSGQRHPKPAAE